LEKRQFFNASGRIITTGPSGGVGADGILPVRKEVRELAREERAWSLYLLAMERMMVADQSDPLSWYQIAGMFLSFSLGYTSEDIADMDRHSRTSI
jgi:tyrosinase